MVYANYIYAQYSSDHRATAALQEIILPHLLPRPGPHLQRPQRPPPPLRFPPPPLRFLPPPLRFPPPPPLRFPPPPPPPLRPLPPPLPPLCQLLRSLSSALWDRSLPPKINNDFIKMIQNPVAAKRTREISQ